jgi:hypothetical protein
MGRVAENVPPIDGKLAFESRGSLVEQKKVMRADDEGVVHIQNGDRHGKLHES